MLTTFLGGDDGESISYDEFIQQAGEGQVESITFDNTNAKITGKLDDGTEFTTTGPLESGIPPERPRRPCGPTTSTSSTRRPPPNPIIGFLLVFGPSC